MTFTPEFGARQDALHVVLMVAHQDATVRTADAEAQIGRLYRSDILLRLLYYQKDNPKYVPDRNGMNYNPEPTFATEFRTTEPQSLCRHCTKLDKHAVRERGGTTCYSPMYTLHTPKYIDDVVSLCYKEGGVLPRLETPEETEGLEEYIVSQVDEVLFPHMADNTSDQVVTDDVMVYGRNDKNQ